MKKIKEIIWEGDIFPEIGEVFFIKTNNEPVYKFIVTNIIDNKVIGELN